MKRIIGEISSGAIIYRKIKGKTEYLLLRNRLGEWEFPKGHLENKEDLHEGAKREVSEELGITSIKLDTDFHHYYQYVREFPSEISYKTVHLFIAHIDSDINLSSEHNDFKWLCFDEALKLLPKDGQKDGLNKAQDYLSS